MDIFEIYGKPIRPTIKYFQRENNKHIEPYATAIIWAKNYEYSIEGRDMRGHPYKQDFGTYDELKDFVIKHQYKEIPNVPLIDKSGLLFEFLFNPFSGYYFCSSQMDGRRLWVN